MAVRRVSFSLSISLHIWESREVSALAGLAWSVGVAVDLSLMMLERSGALWCCGWDGQFLTMPTYAVSLIECHGFFFRFFFFCREKILRRNTSHYNNFVREEVEKSEILLGSASQPTEYSRSLRSFGRCLCYADCCPHTGRLLQSLAFPDSLLQLAPGLRLEMGEARCAYKTGLPARFTVTTCGWGEICSPILYANCMLLVQKLANSRRASCQPFVWDTSRGNRVWTNCPPVSNKPFFLFA